MSDTSQQHGHGPYRSAEPPVERKPQWLLVLVRLGEDDPDPVVQKKKRLWIWGALVAVMALGLITTLLMSVPHRVRPTLASVPKDLLRPLEQFPASETELPPAIPLGPLLVADGPEAPAVLEPGEGATRLRRGDALRVRFNRPMVEAQGVGREVESSPLRFDPPIPGRTSWGSRCSLLFQPDPGAWSTGVSESRLELSPDLTTLGGEELFDDLERVVVLDGSPQVVGHRSQGRVGAGSPLPLYFDAQIPTSSLRGQILAYEIGGGQRTLPFAIASRGQDEDGLHRVDVILRRELEPGVQVALALPPRFLSWSGGRPGVFEYEIEPRPRIEGVDCNVTDMVECAYTSSPGRVIDIGASLRLATSHALAEVDPRQIRVAPPLPELRVALASQGLAQGRLIAIEGEWAPDQVYEVRIGALRTADGQPLRPFPPLAVRSRGHDPRVRVATGRMTWEAGAEPALPFAAINTEPGAVLYRAVEPGQELAAVSDPNRYVNLRPEIEPLAPLAPAARPNRWGAGQFLWNSGARTSRMAVVAFHADPERAPERIPTAFVQTTDLGVTLRATARGLLVWVTSLSTADAVNGADVTVVEVNGNRQATGRTDGDGLAWIGLDSDPLLQGHAVLVAAGSDRAAMLLDPRRARRPAGMGLTPGAEPPEDGTAAAGVLTDRGAYRPSETVRAKVSVRRVRGAGATAVRDQAVRFRLRGPAGAAPVAEAEATLNQWGSAAADLEIPEGSALGRYRVTATTGDDDEEIGHAQVRVAEFRQPAFRVDLRGGADALRAGDTLSMTAEATYLFGAPVSQGQAEWSVNRRGTADYPSRWRGFSFGATGGSWPSGTAAAGRDELDRDGRLAIEAAVPLEAAVRTNLVAEVEVTDRAGHSHAARRELVVFPAEVEVGIRRGDDWTDLGGELDAEAVVIDNEGEPVAGHPVEVRFLREGWHAWWEWSDRARTSGPERPAGYQLRRSQREEEVFRCDLTSEEVPVHCRFAPTRSGTYRLETRARDAAGRETVASRRIYVAGPDEHPDRDPPGAPISVTPSRPRWTAGEEAELAFESPWDEAAALITVEREGLFHREVRRVGAGGQVVRVRLTEEMIPNAFVGVTLIKPRTGEPGAEIDLDAPDLRFGVAELEVRPATSELRVELNLPEGEARVGTEVPVAVRVTDAGGRPVRAEVALWAVDEGTLRLTSYRVPDISESFFRQREPAFAWEDLRRGLLSRVEPPPLPRAGGDGGGVRAPSADLRIGREDIEATPLWLPLLETDEQGRARATIALPERPTEYRVMAVALDAGTRSGRASERLVATQPVVLRQALPRFVTARDRFEARVFVHNGTGAPLQARVVATIGGEARAERVVELGPEAETMLSEEVTAPDEGPIEVRFAATAGDFETAVDRRVSVVPRARWVHAQAVSGFEGEHTVRFELPPGAWRMGGAVTLAVAPHPFIGLESAVRSLEDSYWSGTEVRAAAVAGLAAYVDLAAPGTSRELAGRELRERGEAAVARLLELQTSDGGFGRWSEQDSPRLRETALALHALAAGRRAGFGVEQETLNRVRQALVDVLEGVSYGEDHIPGEPDEYAFVLRVLSENSAREEGRIDALFERSEQLSPGGLADLALALAENDRRLDTLVVRAAEQVLCDPRNDTAGTLCLSWVDRRARVFGPVLEAASATSAAHAQRGELAGELLNQRRSRGGRGWGAVADTARALTALAAYARLFQSWRQEDPRVWLDGRDLEPAVATSAGSSYVLPFDRVMEGPHSLRLRSGDESPVFFSLEGRWAVELSEADEVARGDRVALHRVFETPEGTPIEPGAEVPLGSLIRVRLFIYTEDGPPEALLVRDPLGGGFEAVDAGLDTTARASLRSVLGVGAGDEAIDPRAYHANRTLSAVSRRRFDSEAVTFTLENLGSGLQELTYAVRATTPGEFTIPPAQIEALDDPDFVGRSATDRLRIQ